MTQQIFSVQPETDKENQVSRRKRDKLKDSLNPFAPRVFRDITSATLEEMKPPAHNERFKYNLDNLLVS